MEIAETSLSEHGIVMLSDGEYLFFVDGKIYFICDLIINIDEEEKEKKVANT